MASSKYCQFFIKEKKIQTIKVERNISCPEARKFVSVTNDSSAQKSYPSVTKPVFTSVETQTDITWLNKADKPTRLMVKNTEKIVNSLKKVTNSSQTTSSSRTTTTSDSKSSTSSNSSSHQNKKEQKPKAQNRSLSQRQSKAEKDPVQVHNRYGRLDDAEEESVLNLPPDDSPSPMDESPSETRRSPSISPKGGRRKGSQRKKSFSPIRHP
jgi:predicted RNase H-like nuclease (RuvC/YqgF family)